MRIAAVSQIRPGSSRAHAINAIKTAGGFARLGHEVTFFSQPFETPDPACEYHEHELRWVTAPPFTSGADPDEQFGRWAAEQIRRGGYEFVYARNFWAPLLLAEWGIPVVIETHAYVGAVNPLLDRSLQATRRHTSLRAIITIAPILREHFIARGADPDRVCVVPDGVDFELLTCPTSSPYGNPGPHITYAGHLYDYKGIPTILEAAAELPGRQFHLVGGLPCDIDRTRTRIEALGLRNLTLHGRVAHAKVPAFVQHADVLLLPPSGREASKDWTSPVKLGEYLATGVPIAASAIPALRRVLCEPMVRFFEPDDPSSLARAIECCLSEPADSPSRAARIAHARSLSYRARAARILEAAALGAGERAA
ncbi:MAG: hypothetical protein Kow0022_17330 [Phycisphaerales bacterium]